MTIRAMAGVKLRHRVVAHPSMPFDVKELYVETDDGEVKLGYAWSHEGRWVAETMPTSDVYMNATFATQRQAYSWLAL